MQFERKARGLSGLRLKRDPRATERRSARISRFQTSSPRRPLSPRLFRAYEEEAEASLSLVSLGWCNCASGCGIAGNTNRIADDHLSRREDVRGALARERLSHPAADHRRGGTHGRATRTEEEGERWRQTVKSPRTYRISPGRVIFLSRTLLKQVRVNNPRLGSLRD